MVRGAIAVAAVAILMAVASILPCGAAVQGLKMVGIGSPDDSLVVQDPPGASHPCGWTSYHSTSPQFNRWPPWMLPDDIQRDINLLYSSTFAATGYGLTSDEVDSLLYTFDLRHDNIHALPMKDLELVYDYLSYGGAYTDTSGFEVFSVCGDSAVPWSERDHVDLYLVKWGANNVSYPGCNPTDIYQERGDAQAGTYSAGFVSHLEDPPYDETGTSEWTQNSIKLTDGRGKCTGDTLWPFHASGGASHEFGHLLWQSNTTSVGRAGVEYIEFNELFATAGAWLSAPYPGTISADTPFGQSLVRMHSQYCQGSVYELWPPSCPSWAGWDDCRTRYTNWALFAAYLTNRLDSKNGDYTDDIMYRWTRAESGAGLLMNDMCGLAKALDDDGQYGSVGGQDGPERLGIVFNDFAVAKWVNSTAHDSAYSFGEHLSPVRDFGVFVKVDTFALTGWPYNAWELAVPPRFVVGAPCSWQNVPGNASECTTGWNDPTDTKYGNNSYCDPVVVRLWGSDYIVFQADTLECQVEDDRYFRMEFTFSGGVKTGTELWMDVLKYGCCPDSLYLRGNHLEAVTTYRLTPGTTGKTVEVHDLGEGGTESVVFVLSVVQTGLDYETTQCGWGCLPRVRESYGHPAVDLTYSYRFKVLNEPTGGGCPFLSSLGTTGFVSDNNVLAPAWAGGDDVVDSYLMQQKPDASDGAYRLRLSEAEEEQSRFDRLQLLAVDHDADAEAAVFPDGTIGTYRVTGEPLACRDQDGNDVLSLVLASDGESATVKTDGWLDVVFASGGATRDGGGIGEDGGPYEKVDPFGRGGRGDGGEETLSFAQQCYRANPCVNILDMPGDVVPQDGLITLRLTAPTDYRLDRLFTIERSEEPLTVTHCELLSAHYASQASSCMSALTAEDGVYASLAKGDTIDLAFAVPKMAGEVRDFVLVTRGGEVSRGSDGEDQQPEAAVATISPTISPNPFNPLTAISFAIPTPGGRVAVSIYNMAGKLVRRLADAEMQSGEQSLTWDGRGERGESLGSGVYFCRIETPGQSDQKKLVLLK
jgi:hypothetical protein